jgi:putative transposase
MRPRLQRLDRIYARHPVYFLTLCTVLRQPILSCPTVLNAFRTFCLEGVSRGVHVGRYVIMPDHLHLFVSLPDDTSLGIWVKSLKNTLSKVLRASGQPAPHWQKGFFDHVLRTEKSYEEKWLYVRENPVRAALTADWGDWIYSGEIAPIAFSED